MVPSPLPSAEERLAALRDNQHAFLSSASHELRTPLTSVIGYLELVLDLSQDLGEADRGHLRSALAASQRLADVVDTLVASHRIAVEGVLPDVRAVDVDALIEPVLAGLAAGCARAGVHLVRELDHGGVRPVVDAGAIAWVLGELCANALKFTLPGGRVTVASRADRAAVELTVTDTGIGIPAADRAHVFERFYRSPDALARAVAGTGLGLSIAKAIVDAHGGRISVDSEPDGGTRATVALPVRPQGSCP